MKRSGSPYVESIYLALLPGLLSFDLEESESHSDLNRQTTVLGQNQALTQLNPEEHWKFLIGQVGESLIM